MSFETGSAATSERTKLEQKDFRAAIAYAARLSAELLTGGKREWTCRQPLFL